MSIPACDYDTILASQPTTWRDRGLHYHCFSWRGDGKSMLDSEQARQDLSSEMPPTRVRDWLRKPARMLRTATTTPDDAAAWLRQEYEQVLPQLAGNVVGVEERSRLQLYSLRCGNDTVVLEWLRGGTMIYLAVLAVSLQECDRH